MAPRAQRPDQERIGIVEAFALRSRRALAHSLFEDKRALAALAGGGLVLTQKGGQQEIEWRLPNEEILESLAARVRPLLLQQDGIHHNTVSTPYLST